MLKYLQEIIGVNLAMSNISVPIPLSLVVTLITCAVVIFGTVFGFILRALYRNLQSSTTQKINLLDNTLSQFNRRMDSYFKAHDGLRDRWEDFLKEYLKIDSTRGQKIDALFRIVDQMQETVRDLRPAMNTKIEEAFSRSLSELKLYVRDQISNS